MEDNSAKAVRAAPLERGIAQEWLLSGEGAGGSRQDLTEERTDG